MLSYENRPAIAPPAPAADHLPIPAPTSSTMANGTSQSLKQETAKHNHIWLITGPAGCGKSTVAQSLAKALNLPFIEGDEFHPPANVEKMSQGIPLTDSDRWDWLTQLREEALRRLSAGSEGVILTCSALKRKYRDVIRVAPYYSHDVLVHFVYLDAPKEVLIQRVQSRKGHFMGADMVHSQYSILELPGAGETDVIKVDVSGSPDEVRKEALAKVKEALEAS